MSQTMKTPVIQVARRMALEQAIARKSDEYDRQATIYAERLTQTKLEKTRVRGLEVLACTTDKISAVTDWLKIHVGRDGERKGWAQEGIGRDLLAVLEGLRQDAQQVIVEIKETSHSPYEDPDLERQIHLRLIREYLKHVTAHFEYTKAKGKESK